MKSKILAPRTPAFALALAVLSTLGTQFAVLAQTNIWVSGTDGKWETPANWSLGAPSASHYVFITNAGTKIATIDGTTSGSFPETMTITNLTISAPGGAVNTLVLTNAGTTFPLRLFSTDVSSVDHFGLKVSTGGAITVDNSSLAAYNDAFIGGFNDRGTITVNSGLLHFAGDVAKFGGFGGTGTLNINGGTVLVDSFIYAGFAGGTGIVNVTGGTLLHT